MATCYCCRSDTPDGDSYTACRNCRGRCRRGEDCRVRPPSGWVEFEAARERGELAPAGTSEGPGNLHWLSGTFITDATVRAWRDAYNAGGGRRRSATRRGPVGGTEFARADCTGELSWNTNRRCYLHVPTGQEISLERANSYRNSPDGQAAYREHLSAPAAWRWLIGRGDNSVERMADRRAYYYHNRSGATISYEALATQPWANSFARIDRSVTTIPPQQPQGDMVDAAMYAYRNLTGFGYEESSSRADSKIDIKAKVNTSSTWTQISSTDPAGAEYRIATPAELARINAQADANWKAAKTCSVAWMRGLLGICSWVRPMPRWEGFYSKGRPWAADPMQPWPEVDFLEDRELSSVWNADRNRQRRWLGWRGLAALGTIGKACAVVYQSDTVQRGLMLEMK